MGQLGANFGYWGNLEAVSRAKHIKQCNQCSVLRKLSKNIAANVQFVENFRNAAAKKIFLRWKTKAFGSSCCSRSSVARALLVLAVVVAGLDSAFCLEALPGTRFAGSIGGHHNHRF